MNTIDKRAESGFDCDTMCGIADYMRGTNRQGKTATLREVTSDMAPTYMTHGDTRIEIRPAPGFGRVNVRHVAPIAGGWYDEDYPLDVLEAAGWEIDVEERTVEK